MRMLILLVGMVTTACAQHIGKIVYAGVGVSSSLATDAKSASLIVAGGKLNIPLSGGWFTQVYCGASFVEPTVTSARGFWSIQFGVTPGYRLRRGKSRLAFLAGPALGRNRAGDFLPAIISGPSIKLNRRFGLLLTSSRNSQSWATSATLGYTF